MMHIRPITAGELAAFAAIETSPDHVASVQQYLELMIERGSMRLDWCFVVEDAGALVGRVGSWTLPKLDIPNDFVLLDVPWHGDYSTVGTALLKHVLMFAQKLGTHELGYVLDTPPQPPQWQDALDKRHTLLTNAGFRMIRKTRRFQWQAQSGEPNVPTRLVFHPFSAVDARVALDAIERISEGTLDRRIQAERDELGTTEAARSMLRDLENMDYDPAWWQLAYTSENDLVGLVMPTRNPTFAVIGYIGVVPEQRGQGYSRDLLLQGTAILHASGASIVRADTDTDNVPMANIFLQAGYTQFGTRREYALRIER